jgi:hypothetical protein
LRGLTKAVLTLGLVGAILAGGQEAEAKGSDSIKVKVNGNLIYLDQPPVMDKGRVLVPMRTIFELFGSEVDFNQQTKTIKATRGKTIISLPLNSKQVTVNGVKKSLDTPAKSIKGRTLVPLRFVSETLGSNVKWRPEYNQVDIAVKVKEKTGRIYPDGWVAPILQSKWAGSDWVYNGNLIEDTLGFFDEIGDGRSDKVWGTPDIKDAIVLNEVKNGDDIEIILGVDGFYDTTSPYSYRIPIVLKEILHFYFEGDADKVAGYLESDESFREFTANGRKVELSLAETPSGRGPYISMVVSKKEPLPRTGKTYPDGWTAPVLQSKFVSDERIIHGVLERELGFIDGGRVFKVMGMDAIQVFDSSWDDNIEMTIRFQFWADKAVPESYKIPIITKELFKFFFDKDADRVMNYFNRNDIPDNFNANGRSVHAYADPISGAVLLDVSYKKN